MNKTATATVGVIAHQYAEASDIRVPFQAFQDAGFTVHLISAAPTLAIETRDHAGDDKQLTADRQLSACDPASYDAVVLTGGIENGDALRNDPDVLAWISEFIGQEKPLAAIGYAVWALVSADAVEGVRLTSAPNMKTDVVNAGGEWVNMPVIVDHMLLTCRGSDDIEEFTNRFLGRIRQYAFMNTASAEQHEKRDERRGRPFLRSLDNYNLAATEYTGRGRILQPAPLDGDDEAGDTY